MINKSDHESVHDLIMHLYITSFFFELTSENSFTNAILEFGFLALLKLLILKMQSDYIYAEYSRMVFNTMPCANIREE